MEGDRKPLLRLGCRQSLRGKFPLLVRLVLLELVDENDGRTSKANPGTIVRNAFPQNSSNKNSIHKTGETCLFFLARDFVGHLNIPVKKRENKNQTANSGIA